MNRFELTVKFIKAKRKMAYSRENIKKYQEKKLKKVLIYAYKHSEFYREYYENEGITKENIKTKSIKDFPTIDKNIFLKNFDKIITDKSVKTEDLIEYDKNTGTDRTPYLGKYHIVHSSGSTGTPGYFVYDKQAWNDMLVGIIRAALWDLSVKEISKLLKSKPHILYIAATDGHYGGAMAVGDGIDGVGCEQMQLDINTPLSEWADKVKDFKPNIVIGYPSAIKILGDVVEENNIKLDINRVISCGEPLSHTMRAYFEKTFGIPVINFYGASESIALGVEDRKDNMLLFDDMNYVEVIDGQMYLTSLYNFTQPIIRYRISDEITLSEPEMNELPFTKVSGLMGRNEDVLWFKDKNENRDFLHPLSIEGICIDELRDYQFIKTGESSFKILCEIYRDADETKLKSELRKKVEQILKDKTLSYVSFDIEVTDRIAPNPKTGKKRLVIN